MREVTIEDGRVVEHRPPSPICITMPLVEYEQLQARLVAAEAIGQLTGCCTVCGQAPFIGSSHVNDIVCHHVRPSCGCLAPLNLWHRKALAP